MEPKATMPMTPNMTTMVPLRSVRRRERRKERKRRYIDIVAGNGCSYEKAGKEKVEYKGS